MLSSSLLGAIAALSIALLTVEAGLLGGRFLQGLASGSNWTAALALLSHAFDPREIGSAAGSAFLSGSFGTLLGPLLGQSLYRYGGAIYAMGFLAALCVLDGIGRFMLTDRLLLVPTAPSTVSISLKNWILWPALLSALIFSAALHFLPAILPSRLLFTGEVSKHDPIVTGYLFMVMAGTYGISAQMAGLDSLAHLFQGRKGVSMGLCGAGLALISCGTLACSSVPWSFASLALLGASLGLGMLPVIPELTRVVESLGSTEWGTTFSLFNLFFTIGAMLGPLVATALSPAPQDYCTACIACGSALLVLWLFHLLATAAPALS